MIVELLKERDVLPSFERTGTDTVVFALNTDLYSAAVVAATTLRENGQSVDVVLEKRKPKWVFRHADRTGAKFCLIVAPDEYENGEVSVKDLESGEQSSIKLDALADWAKGN